MKYLYAAFLIILTSSFFTKYNLNDKIDNLKKIDSLITSTHNQGSFNGNLLLAKGDKILYSTSLGFANGKKDKLSLNDKFLIGSIYKEIPAIGILKLEESKSLNLNDKISNYIPDMPNWADSITIKNLIEYTSGLPKVNWNKHQVINNQNLINDLKELSNLKFRPGTDYLYSNYSPFLLAQIIENVSGMKYEDFINNNILIPQNMTKSVFYEDFPFKKNDSITRPLNSELKESYPPFKIKTNRFLYASTVKDLYKLNFNLHQHNIISKTSLRKIATPPSLTIENLQTALGRVKYKNDLITEHIHHGSSGNYESLLYFKNGLTIILMTNQKNSNLFKLCEKIENLYYSN
jgi:CubicO group peptidase (beta-lactamase class C family)